MSKERGDHFQRRQGNILEPEKSERMPLTVNVGLLLRSLREKHETKRYQPDIHDLANLFRAERDDHKAKSGNHSEMKQTKTSWDAMIESVIHLQADEVIGESEQKAIDSYLETHIETSGAKATNATLAKDIRVREDRNQHIYKQLKEAFYTVINRSKDDKPMSKEESEKLMKDLLPSAEEFTQYDINLETTNAILDKMGRPEKYTFGQMDEFLEALKKDVGNQQKRYEENPKWKVKKEIVLSAQRFYKEHEKDEARGLIYVTAATDGSIRQVGWQTTADENPDTQEYVIDPKGEIDDKKSLSYHLYNLDQFTILLEDALPAAYNTVQKLRTHQELDPQEAAYLRILLERFAGWKIKEEKKPSREMYDLAA